MNVKIFGAFVLSAALVFSTGIACAGHIEVRENQLFIDNEAQPQIFGAEVQYFRLRGGYERNISRDKVLALWAQALDRVVEAKMNAISFYIPWDFHEYAPGKFDFDGTVDEDGDGKPDYPSRDVKTFIKMVEARGIKHVMIRPGPYVNAEWGFLGFGAVPVWFHEKYPESHMQNSNGLRTKLYDYHNPDLLRETQVYFTELYNQVLKPYIGPGKMVAWLQLDNETNFMWQSLYNHDYGPPAIKRYHDFLQASYKDISTLNSVHHRSWQKFEDIQAPKFVGMNIAEDQDWYRFEDQSIYEYLHKIRTIWENLGVHEPDVMFTLADSYNATQNGLLPNYKLHNTQGVTGLMTVNMYPKTYETNEHPLLNLPFKSDHDVKAAEAASEFYLGDGKHFAMGPEIQAGWWRGIEVTPEARQQTYLSVIGHGLKAFFVYYFNEGDNWQTEWAKNQITPIYQDVRSLPAYKNMSESQLPNAFWEKVQVKVDHQILVGFDAVSIMSSNPKENQALFFDSPLDHDAIPRNHFYQLKNIGEKLVAPYGEWLGKASEVTDPVCLVKDVADNVPTTVIGIDNVQLNSDWSAGLLAYALRAGINLRVIIIGTHSDVELKNCQVILRQDHGDTLPAFAQTLKALITQGKTVVNFLDDSMATQMGVNSVKIANPTVWPAKLTYDAQTFNVGYNPLFQYATPTDPRCSSVMMHENAVTGYRCTIGQGSFYQVGALFYDIYNTHQFAILSDLPAREHFLQNILLEANVKASIHVDADRVVAFARKVKDDPKVWVTVKSSQLQDVSTFTQVQALVPDQSYVIHNLLEGGDQTLRGSVLSTQGFALKLKANGSNVFVIEPVVKPALKL